MFTPDVDNIRHRMNEFAKNKKPFLFGVNFELTEGFFIEEPMNQTEILFSLKGVTNLNMEKKTNISLHEFNYSPITFEEYKSKFDIVHHGLHSGYSYLTNLTIKTPISTNLSLRDIFIDSSAKYKLFVPDRFVCFSPERFVKIEEDVISTNPMKGTIEASLPNAAETILNDFKETAEHNTIVDLLRNDLSIVADDVKVNRFRYLDHIRTNKKDILQVSSEISGRLMSDKREKLGDVIFGMLPAGSVSGAPKRATMDIIRRAEKEDRGYYTGVFGYYDGKVLDTAVLIRFIEQQDSKYYFRSGGGITVYSDAESEYKEVLDKIYLPMI